MRGENKARLGFGLVALLIAAAPFVFLGRGLNEPDEGRYAEIGREMVATGEWLVPHLNGFEHFQKPPLLYWATAASLHLFGVNEWAARLPSTLAALGVAALTWWMGCALFGRRVGGAAAMILASSMGFFVAARLLTPDMFLTLWITAAIACLVQIHRGRGAQWGWLFFIAMGLGFLTKGPMALVVPISAALALRWRVRRNGGTLPLPWLGGMLLALAIGLSWFVAVAAKYPPLWRYFLGYELLQRFASSAHGRSRPVWFFLPVIVAGLLPWAVLLPACIRDGWRRWRSERQVGPATSLLLGWIVPPLIVLSISGSKLPTYVLPLFPAVALALASWWQRRDFSSKPLAITTMVALSLYITAASLVDHFNDDLKQQASVRPLAMLLRQQPDHETATIFACNVRAHGWEFYLGQVVSVTRDQADIVLPVSPAQQARLFAEAEDCEREMSRRSVAYGLIRSRDFLRCFPEARWRVLGQAGDFLLLAKARDSGAGKH